MLSFLAFPLAGSPAVDPFGLARVTRQTTARLGRAMAEGLEPWASLSPLAALMARSWTATADMAEWLEQAHPATASETGGGGSGATAWGLGVGASPAAGWAAGPLAAVQALGGPMLFPLSPQTVSQIVEVADRAARAVAEAVVSGQGGAITIGVTDPQSPVSVFVGLRVAPRATRDAVAHPGADHAAGAGPILDLTATPAAADATPAVGDGGEPAAAAAPSAPTTHPSPGDPATP